MKFLAGLLAFVIPMLAALLVYKNTANCGEREIFEVTPKYRSRYVKPDGRSNPYIVRDRHGKRIGEIRTKFFDPNPGDGFNDPGSRTNPYRFEKREERK